MQPPELTIHEDATTYVLQFQGDWTLVHGLPRRAAVWKATGTRHAFCLDFNQLGAWDSLLLSFVAQLKQQLQAESMSCTFQNAPQGLELLLELSQARGPSVPRKQRPSGFLNLFGRTCVRFYYESYAFVCFVGETVLGLGRLIRGRSYTRWRDVALMLEYCGMDALPVVSLISILIGVILSFVGIVQLRQFGAELYVADLVGLAIVREMGALMVGIILAGRTGASFAAQIGNMVVSEEIDALKTLGVPPIDFLVLPRVLALVFMVPLLCIYADVIGILGGIMLSMSMMEMNITQYLNELALAVSLTDVSTGLIKSVAFGTVVALVGCLRGLQCQKSAEGVGRATTSAVVTAIVLIVFCDTLFAFVFNILGI